MGIAITSKGNKIFMKYESDDDIDMYESSFFSDILTDLEIDRVIEVKHGLG